AESRAAAHDRARRDLDTARQHLRIHAPEGIEALRAAQSQAQARRGQLQALLASLPDALEPVDLAQAEQEARTATAETEHAAHTVMAARSALDRLQAQVQLLQTQWAARQKDFIAPERAAQREERGAKLVEARARLDTLAQRCQDAQAALQAHQPELIEQDAQRFEQSARLVRQEQERRHAELLQLQGKLEQAQAQGVGEQLLQAQAEAQRLARRRDEFALRAQALDLLWRLLGERRAAATQRLLQPLSLRLQHYVGLLFPGAQWRLDEALRPAAVARGQGDDALEALSFGTREQLGVLARLAYADLLQQAGRPTLLVLDDTLVHADQARRELMKRALYDAASRHQVLLFTCHGEAWQDMGVAVREVPGASMPGARLPQDA
ncbi:GTP-binding protein, partial [Bordetella petrii]|nr:GTP-binding protein [Bordetella petrii]